MNQNYLKNESEAKRENVTLDERKFASEKNIREDLGGTKKERVNAEISKSKVDFALLMIK